ncbi:MULTISPECIES: hydroxyacid dehydrogenase [unclassified Pseudomonas]|uniref:hydroxyacid dehydrogenase n=1 Tax=unclassified Pseudomonas TaxID=196821 RepID=UPI000D372012|nr:MULTISPECIES: hydroxyacid dehydrogenase [unclassified Pseudomonas]RAU47885.1 hydroxyacid dehydrogenase [Pseudomonas sp. RIT 409]RAU55421.1 hydroxyacid dehydrogenase [Pseudomonas sp. RIT 412]
MPYTILVTAPTLAPAGRQLLEAGGHRVIYLPESADGATIEKVLVDEPVDAVISRTLTLSAAAIQGAPRLKVISKHGVGVSNIAVDAATARGIPVYVTPGANAQSVAEMALGLLLAAARRIAWMDAQLRDGRWSRAQDGIELSGRTLGLVGFGQVARRLWRACQALGMSAWVYDPFLPQDAELDGAQRAGSLAELLDRSHVLSLHIPLTPQTRGLIGTAELAALPPDAILINTARGEVVDEAALIAALRSGALYAAGLDTTAQEPLMPGNPLLTLKNVVLTPHVGGSTPAALAAMAEGAVRNVLGFLAGNPPAASACVNPSVLS